MIHPQMKPEILLRTSRSIRPVFTTRLTGPTPSTWASALRGAKPRFCAKMAVNAGST